MLMIRLRIAAGVLLAVGAVTVGVMAFDRQDRAAGAALEATQEAVKNGKPHGDATFPFHKVSLGTDDLVDATGLDIYSFRSTSRRGNASVSFYACWRARTRRRANGSPMNFRRRVTAPRTSG